MLCAHFYKKTNTRIRLSPFFFSEMENIILFCDIPAFMLLLFLNHGFNFLSQPSLWIDVLNFSYSRKRYIFFCYGNTEVTVSPYSKTLSTKILFIFL
jgi:hypothetical protein